MYVDIVVNGNKMCRHKFKVRVKPKILAVDLCSVLGKYECALPYKLQLTVDI